MIHIRSHWHVVAKVIFIDGRIGVKVLPRVLPSILKFYNAVISQKEIRDIELYMSNNVFFNKYPNSSTLRIYFIDKVELDKYLADAEHMGCDGKLIIRKDIK